MDGCGCRAGLHGGRPARARSPGRPLRACHVHPTATSQPPLHSHGGRATHTFLIGAQRKRSLINDQTLPPCISVELINLNHAKGPVAMPAGCRVPGRLVASRTEGALRHFREWAPSILNAHTHTRTHVGRSLSSPGSQ